MSETKQKLVSKYTQVWDATEAALGDWSLSRGDNDGNLKIPVLLGMVALRLNWNSSQVRENDPIVRQYLRASDGWHVTAGAHGGVMPASDRQKKEAARSAKEAAELAKNEIRRQVEAAVEAKLAEARAQAANTVDHTDLDELDLTEEE